MSHKLINHSPDLKKLRDEGYVVQIQGGFVLLKEIPYVNAQPWLFAMLTRLTGIKRSKMKPNLTLAEKHD